jgi:uncharacterized protein
MPRPHPEADAPLPPALRLRAALTELRAVYRRLDALYAPFHCPASGECCQLAKTGRPPWLWTAEWRLLEERLRAQGRPLPDPRADGGCPFLDESGRRCSVYEDRPSGCRTYFCGRRTGPQREPQEALIALSRRIERIASRLDPERTGPVPLPAWFTDGR